MPKKQKFDAFDPKKVNLLRQRELVLALKYKNSQINEAYSKIQTADIEDIQNLRKFIFRAKFEKTNFEKELIQLREYERSLTLKGINAKLQVRSEKYKPKPIL